MFETTNVEAHELRAYEVLRLHGHSFRVLAVDPQARARGLSSLDMEMYGSLWELKCPRGSNAKKTITRNLNKAVLQAQHASVPIEHIRIVLSALETSLEKDDVVSIVEKKLREGKIDELILILNEDDIRYYKKGTEIPIALLFQTGGCLRMSNDTTMHGAIEAPSEHEKAEIPIALLVQMGGCLRNWDYSIGAELAGSRLQVVFGCVRPRRSSARYRAVRLEGASAQGRKALK
ncbi:MAG: hypothetical protein IJ087_21760 [Eggerthellaceae bacterium]|nr:hypothetical protein [Eggerthellaceae bacterium]